MQQKQVSKLLGYDFVVECKKEHENREEYKKEFDALSRKRARKKES